MKQRTVVSIRATFALDRLRRHNLRTWVKYHRSPHVRRTSSCAARFAALGVMCWGLVVAAAEPPPVAANIPQDVVYALFISKPDEMVANLTSILNRFKSFSPELDLAQKGNEIKAAVGENLLSRQGLEAFGIDLSGTAALYSSDIRGGDRFLAAIPLKDPKAFKDKLWAVIEKESQGKFKPEPKQIGGVELYAVDDVFVGFQGPWCVFENAENASSDKGKKEATLLNFFAKGKKLNSSPAFSRALSGMPSGQQGWLFVDIKLLSEKLDAGMAAMVAEMGKYNKGGSKQQQAEFKKRMQDMRNEQRNVMKALAFIESASLGWTLKGNAVEMSSFLATQPAGLKILKKVFPPERGAPAFHEGLKKSTVLGGWLSLDLNGLIDQFGSVPADSGKTVKQELAAAAAELKKATRLDLAKDILGQLKGPWSTYLLVPEKGNVKSDAPIMEQIASWVRLVAAVRVADGARVSAVMKQLGTLLPTGALGPETTTVSGATLMTFSKETELPIVLGVKGDTLFWTFGRATAEAFAQKLTDTPWVESAGGEVASAQLDFPTLTESITTAVSSGVGGDSAAEFRTAIWPMAQAVLAKFGQATFSGKLLPGGLQLATALDFR